MKPERLLLLSAGILGILAFFLPFAHLIKVGGIVDLNMSGLTLVQAGLDGAELMSFKKGGKILEFLVDYWTTNEDIVDYLSFFGMLFVLLGPVFFMLHSLGYLFKGMRGVGSYRKGIVFLVIYTAITWAGIYFGGQYYNVKINFFNRAGIGFWLGAGAIVLAWISSFMKPKDSEIV